MDTRNKPATRVRLKEQPSRAHVQHDQQPAPAAKRAPNRKELTEGRVANLKVDPQRSYLVWDDGVDGQRGLAVMVLPSGVKTYYAYAYMAGSSNATSFKVGRVGEMSLAEARKRTAAARQKAQDGIDPKFDDPRRSQTFSEVVEDWYTLELTGRKDNRSAVASRSLVLFHCRRWLKRPMTTIRTEEIEGLLARIRDVQRKAATANRMHAHLATLFRWAARTKRITSSPMLDMPRPVKKIEPRDRAWFRGEAADDLIKRLWHVATKMGGDRERFIKLAILLGKRRTAIMEMQWSDIDSTWFWTPTPTSATKRITAIPLPALAQRVLGPKQESGRAMLINEGMITRLLSDLRKMLELPDFLLHGLRHIAETRMGELDVVPHIRDLLLDHAVMRSATGRGYDHGLYKAQLLTALEKWASHVEELVAPGQGVSVLR